MIPVPSGVRVWLAVGRTDMRRGMNGLALQVQEALRCDPHAGDLFVFRGARGDLIKIIWHDGLGMSLYAKRLERGRFIWPSPTDGIVGISASQLAYMLDGIDWRNPRHTFPPGACWIVADAAFFCESSVTIYDSISAWIRVVKPFRMT